MTTASIAQPHPFESIGERTYRVDAIDLLRGLVMIIMALDHTRDFFHRTAYSDDPMNLATTTPFLYFTRWITHLCAPVFVFLAGSSVYFQSLRKTKKELTVFLTKRGLWLILVDLTLMTFAYNFNSHFPLFGLQTLWSIGISMIILGCMIRLPFPAIIFTGLVIVAGHNLLDLYEKNTPLSPGIWYNLLHRPGIINTGGGHTLFITYPFLSWAGLMMLGFAFGKLFLRFEGQQRKKVLLMLGLGLLAFFTILRFTNVYGDPLHWSSQKNTLFTFLSFMKVQKYPPSLLYMCATMGIAMLLLALMGKARNRLAECIMVYGRVPFFYYVLHFLLIHILAMVFFLASGHTWAEGTKDASGLIPYFIIQGQGYSLAVVYGVWAFVVISLYPVCKWFSQYKQKHRYRWLSYL